MNGAIFNNLEQPLTLVFNVTLFFDAEYPKQLNMRP